MAQIEAESQEQRLLIEYRNWLKAKPQDIKTEHKHLHMVTTNRPIYADIAGDFIAGAVLSQLSYWSLELSDNKGDVRCADNDGWVAKSNREWWDELRLSDSQIDSAIKRLQASGLIRVAKRQFAGHPTRHFQIVKSELLARFAQATQASVALASDGQHAERPKPKSSRPDVSARNAAKAQKPNDIEQTPSGKNARPIPIIKENHSLVYGNGTPLNKGMETHKQGNVTETSAETTDRDLSRDYIIEPPSTNKFVSAPTGAVKKEDTQQKKSQSISQSRNAFTEPTQDELISKARTLPIVQRESVTAEAIANQCELFFAHHATRGWLLKGNIKMKSWESALVTWFGNAVQYGTLYPKTGKPAPTMGKPSFDPEAHLKPGWKTIPDTLAVQGYDLE